MGTGSSSSQSGSSSGSAKRNADAGGGEKPPRDLTDLILRYEWGKDLWSGLPLQGEDAENWLRIQDEMGEQEAPPEEVDRVLEGKDYKGVGS